MKPKDRIQNAINNFDYDTIKSFSVSDWSNYFWNNKYRVSMVIYNGEITQDLYYKILEYLKSKEIIW